MKLAVPVVHFKHEYSVINSLFIPALLFLLAAPAVAVEFEQGDVYDHSLPIVKPVTE